MKRTKKRNSMHQDVAGGWVYGWGGRVNRMNRRLQRAKRKQQDRREAAQGYR